VHRLALTTGGQPETMIGWLSFPVGPPDVTFVASFSTQTRCRCIWLGIVSKKNGSIASSEP
jgi:hypothetical protein